MKANCIGDILRRNCLLKHVIEGKIGKRIEVTGRRERRCKKLLDDVMETTGYWKLKEETLDRTLWRTCLGREYGPEICAFLGYYAVSCGNCLPTFRENVSVPLSRVKNPRDLINIAAET